MDVPQQIPLKLRVGGSLKRGCEKSTDDVLWIPSALAWRQGRQQAASISVAYLSSQPLHRGPLTTVCQ